MSPGDNVLMYETGHFASLWQKMATRLGISTEFLAFNGTDDCLPQAPGWRRGVQADLIEVRLRKDTEKKIKAVCVVHNETSTGVTSNIPAVRKAIDAAKHPALLIVDSISGLASADFRHDEWGVDVTISGSQKGLMLPPGISFNAISPRALEAMKSAKLPRSFWAWDEIVEMNKDGYWPYTPNTNLLYGLSESMDMLLARKAWPTSSRAMRAGPKACALGRDRVGTACPVRRHERLLAGVDRCHHARRHRCGRGASAHPRTLRHVAGHRVGQAQGADVPHRPPGRQQRPDPAEPTLAGCEMGLKLSGVKLAGSGVQEAMDYFSSHSAPRRDEQGRVAKPHRRACRA